MDDARRQWQWERVGRGWLLRGAGMYCSDDERGQQPGAEVKALIAAAPELRDALVECVSVLGLITASREGPSYRDFSIKAQATANALLARLGKDGA